MAKIWVQRGSKKSGEIKFLGKKFVCIYGNLFSSGKNGREERSSGWNPPARLFCKRTKSDSSKTRQCQSRWSCKGRVPLIGNDLLEKRSDRGCRHLLCKEDKHLFDFAGSVSIVGINLFKKTSCCSCVRQLSLSLTHTATFDQKNAVGLNDPVNLRNVEFATFRRFTG